MILQPAFWVFFHTAPLSNLPNYISFKLFYVEFVVVFFICFLVISLLYASVLLLLWLSFIHSPKLSLKLTFDIKFFLTTSAPNVLPSPKNAHTKICSNPWYLVNSSYFFYEFTSTTKSSLKVERTFFSYERRKCTVVAFKSEKPGFNSQLYHYDSDIFLLLWASLSHL